jgi:hypothetical protein
MKRPIYSCLFRGRCLAAVYMPQYSYYNLTQFRTYLYSSVDLSTGIRIWIHLFSNTRSPYGPCSKQLRPLLASFSPQKFEFRPRSVHKGFVVDKLALVTAFSEYCGFPFQFLFTKCFFFSLTYHSELIQYNLIQSEPLSPHPKPTHLCMLTHIIFTDHNVIIWVHLLYNNNNLWAL